MKGRFLNSKTTTMQIKGTIIALLPLQIGQGKNGEWKKQEFILCAVKPIHRFSVDGM